MSGVIGPIQAPQTRPNQQLLPQGSAGSYPIFFLKATPPVYTALFGRGGNHVSMIQAYQPIERQQVLLGTRIYRGIRPAGLTIEVEASIASVGAVTAAVARTQLLAASISSLGSVTGTFVRLLRSLASSIVSTAPVAVDVSGGSLQGQLGLTAEDTDSLTLTAETAPPGPETLTSEDTDTLTLTPG